MIGTNAFAAPENDSGTSSLKPGEWEKIPLAGEFSIRQRFIGRVPEVGQLYRVITDGWNDDYSERTIFEWVSAE